MLYTFMFGLEELHSSPADWALEPASEIAFFFLIIYLFFVIVLLVMDHGKMILLFIQYLFSKTFRNCHLQK